MKVLNLKNYDLIGFDLDHTLLKYNLTNQFSTQYEFLVSLLKNEKGYNINVAPITPGQIDFLCRGLFLDELRGNLLKLNNKGVVLKASHGTKPLSDLEIFHEYGKKRVWLPIYDYVSKNKRGVSPKGFLEYTDAIGSLVYAVAVDSLDRNMVSSYEKVWADVSSSILTMYSFGSSWANDFFTNVKFYLNKTDKKVISWIENLRRNSHTALITSAHPVSATRTAEYALGPRWKDLFDIIVYSARKPSFFTGHRPYYALNGLPTEFLMEGEYINGSWSEMERVLTLDMNRLPKFLYFGDSPSNDFYSEIDVVSIVEETKVERFFPGVHPDTKYLKSNYWGSIFYENKTKTYFAETVFDTTFCAPDLEYFSDFNIDVDHYPFWTTEQRKSKAI